MQKVTKFVAGCAIAASMALGSAGMAQADGMAPGKAKAAAEAPLNWSGVYFGINSGWAWSTTENVYTSGANWSADSNTGIVGGQIGIQHQYGNFVVGLEGTISAALQDDPGSATTCNGCGGAATNQFFARFDDVLTIGPRVGWAMEKWLPYVTGGYANAKFSDSVYGFTTPPGSTTPAYIRTVEGAERHSGWYIGAGVDWMVAKDWVLGIEYRHYDFSDETYTRVCPLAAAVGVAGVAGSGCTLNNSGIVDPGLDTVTLRLSWKWGRPEPVVSLK